ncbi:MAG: thioredoxin [Gloeocapsa sp. DLM2.Bin57]|nr:MAG: thioredoxin [Gloeocapsa sp. DLM2.Bin57]
MSTVQIIEDSANFQEVIKSEQPVLAYFWASWCGPCRLVSPSIEWVSKEYGDRVIVIKLEIDKNQAAVAHCQVEGVPALRLFKNAAIIATHEGAITKQQLQGFLEPYI